MCAQKKFTNVETFLFEVTVVWQDKLQIHTSQSYSHDLPSKIYFRSQVASTAVSSKVVAVSSKVVAVSSKVVAVSSKVVILLLFAHCCCCSHCVCGSCIGSLFRGVVLNPLLHRLFLDHDIIFYF